MEFFDELLAAEYARRLVQWIKMQDTDFQLPVSNLACEILGKIHTVICNRDLDDFHIVEEVVRIFEEHHISTNACHDFG